MHYTQYDPVKFEVFLEDIICSIFLVVIFSEKSHVKCVYNLAANKKQKSKWKEDLINAFEKEVIGIGLPWHIHILLPINWAYFYHLSLWFLTLTDDYRAFAFSHQLKLGLAILFLNLLPQFLLLLILFLFQIFGG